MNRNYTGYTAEQLLNDNFFIQSELHPTEESEKFWNLLRKENESLDEEIQNARLFLHTIKSNAAYTSLPDNDVHTLWQLIHKQNADTDRRVKRRHFLLLTVRSVASVLLLLATGWYITRQKEKTEPDYQAIMASIPAADSTAAPVQLLLSHNEKLMIDGTNPQIEYKKEGEVNVNSKQVNRAGKDNRHPGTEFNQLIVPVGKRSSVTFADGTRIWVSSGSKVIYPIKFAREKREIFVEGEVFLHVSRNEHTPFIVKTHRTDITVLGTQFNVADYKNEADMQVVLVSGKVEINLHNRYKNVLAPNEMFYYNGEMNKGKITTVDVNDYVAWKDGYYQFRQQPLREIVKKLSRYYGTPIVCDKSAASLSCSGKLDLKESLDGVMKALKEATPIEIKRESESIKINVKH